jgi:hypothetical protein
MRPLRLILALGLAAGWFIAGANPAAAGATGPCSTTFNGIAVDRIDSLSSPLELTVDDDLIFTGTDPGTTSEAVVEIAIGPVIVASEATAYAPASDAFVATIDLDGVSPYGVGLMRIRGTTDGCLAEAWLRVTGRFPLATLTGITAAGLTIGGITGQLGAVASRRRWSRTAAALGGIVTGTGAAVLGQQFGRLQLSYASTALVVVVASGLGFALASLLGPGRRDRRRELAVDPVSRPSPAAAATPTVGREEEPGPRYTSERRFSAAPYWCYVLAETEVLDLDDHSRVVSHLRPGTWYLAKRESGPWLHVATGDGVDGWVSRDAVHRQG